MKKIITTCVFLMLISGIFATTFIVGGINYSTTSANTVEVTSGGTYTGSITIPSSVIYSSVTYNVTAIGYWAFNNCFGLSSISIPSSVTSIGNAAFNSCSSLTSITIPSSVTSIGADAFVFCSYLTSINIPNSVISIGDDAFFGTAWYDNQPNGIVYAGTLAYKYKGTVPTGSSIVLNTGTTGIVDYAFQNCTSLTSITIPSSVSSIGRAVFSGCTGLTSVTIPSSVTSIGNNAFYYCSSLISIAIPNSVIRIGDSAFSGCTNLITITIPSSVISIGREVFSGTAWYDNQPNGLLYVGKVAYKYKGTMPTGTSIILNTGTTEIAYNAFSDCSGLTSIAIPNSVTSIGYNAFNNCVGLTSLPIPSSVTSIGYDAFYNCSGLTSIYAYSTTPVYLTLSDSTNFFYNVNKTLCKLYVPIGSLNLYKSANRWKDFTNIIEMTTSAVSTIKDISINVHLNIKDDAICINGLDEGTIRLFNMNGKLLLYKQISDNASVFINILPKGVYIVKLITARGTMEQKVIKK